MSSLPDGVGKTTRFPWASTESRALDRGSGMMTIPAPPPYGMSSALRWTPSAKSLKSMTSYVMMPFSTALFMIEDVKKGTTISGNNVSIVICMLSEKLRHHQLDGTLLEIRMRDE